MGYFVASLGQLLGLKPRKPKAEQQAPEVKEIYFEKRKVRLTKEALRAAEEAHERSRHRHKWRNRRWVTLILVNLLFVVCMVAGRLEFYTLIVILTPDFWKK